ncbi:MAG: cytochrome c oxidase subunit II [Actinobacteria bacterium]|nr:cytochrome c oxidase subunit II [Actinomycetota bacterium]
MSDRLKRRLGTGALLTVSAVVLGACAENAPQDSLSPAGPYARQIDTLFRPVFWIAVAVFVLVQGLLLYAVFRFRHRGDRGIPVQVHGNRRLEIAWTIIPAMLLAGIAIPTVGTIFSLDRRPAGDVLDIRVVGHQWWWDVEYPTLGVVTANEVHIPAGRPVRLSLETEDVIHSFWIPRLAGKQDMLPGRTTTLNIQADEPGTYEGQCTEFCGASHANMQFLVIAQVPAEFDAWVQDQGRPAVAPAAGSPAAQGAEIFVRGTEVGSCVGCHAIEGVQGAEARIGPNLTHFGSRATFAGAIFQNNAENLRAWLDDPDSVKPGARMPDYNLTREEIEALVAYLQGLE